MAADRLSATELRVLFGKHAALDGVSIEFARGRWTSIVGANGAGKTTLLHTLAGWRKPTAGALALDGAPPGPSYRQDVVLAPAPEQLPPHLTGAEVIDIVARERGRTRIGGWADAFAALDGEAWNSRPVAELSWGTRKKLCLATAIATGPDFLLLDEAFDGLDSVSSIRIRQYVRSQASAGALGVVSASHAWESVFVDSDAVAFLAQGKLVRTMDAPQFQSLGEDARRIQDVVQGAFRPD
ncbi:MAG: ABC transporter ATP-binding protein [Hyphomonadaceae bacterium]